MNTVGRNLDGKQTTETESSKFWIYVVCDRFMA